MVSPWFHLSPPLKGPRVSFLPHSKVGRVGCRPEDWGEYGLTSTFPFVPRDTVGTWGSTSVLLTPGFLSP